MISTIMAAGHSAVDIALYTLMPIMVVMMFIMKYLEVRGVLARVINLSAPILKPFGLAGLSLFVLIQLNFVSFAAPVATLAMMDKKGISDRHLASTLAMVFAMGQANVFYPLAPNGLNWMAAIIVSIIGGLTAGAATWYWFGRRLSDKEVNSDENGEIQAPQSRGLLSIISSSGEEAIKLALGAVPMLTLSLTIVGIFKSAGLITILEHALLPALNGLNIPTILVMPTLVKFLAGGTAFLGVATQLISAGKLDAHMLNEYAGWFIHTLDLPGIGIMMGAGFRVARVARFAIFGGIIGILLRTFMHVMLF